MEKKTKRKGPTIDLHMHSTYSDDGEYSPVQLIQQAKAKGIKVLSISDHNSVRANEEARIEAKKVGIHYIPAIEIDCTFQGLNFHVLGYGISNQQKDFTRIEENITNQSKHASCGMLKKVKELGFIIQAEELEALAGPHQEKDCWTGEMFAEVLLNKPEYCKHPLLTPYRANGSRCDNPYVNFYWDYFSQGKPCYVPITIPSLQEVIDIIHRNGGLAVLAHPGMNLKGHEELLSQLIQTGLDGIEAFSSYHTTLQALHFYKEALYYNLFVTCGSDYHGKTKPAIELGDHRCMIAERVLKQQLSKLLLL